MLGTQGLPKGPHWDGRVADAQMRPLIALSGPEHNNRRKPWNRAFNIAALKGYEEIIEGRAVQLVQALNKKSGPVDLSMWMSFFTYDFMSDMA